MKLQWRNHQKIFMAIWTHLARRSSSICQETWWEVSKKDLRGNIHSTSQGSWHSPENRRTGKMGLSKRASFHFPGWTGKRLDTAPRKIQDLSAKLNPNKESAVNKPSEVFQIWSSVSKQEISILDLAPLQKLHIFRSWKISNFDIRVEKLALFLNPEFRDFW